MLPLGLSARISAAHGAIQKKSYGSGLPLDLALRTIALIISNEEMEDIMIILKLLNQDYWIWKIFKDETKNKNEYFFECYQEHWLLVC